MEVLIMAIIVLLVVGVAWYAVSNKSKGNSQAPTGGGSGNGNSVQMENRRQQIIRDEGPDALDVATAAVVASTLLDENADEPPEGEPTVNDNITPTVDDSFNTDPPSPSEPSVRTSSGFGASDSGGGFSGGSDSGGSDSGGSSSLD